MRREAGEDFQPFVARIRLQLKVPTPLRLAVASWFCQIGGVRPGRGHGGVRPRAVIMTTVQKSVPCGSGCLEHPPGVVPGTVKCGAE